MSKTTTTLIEILETTAFDYGFDKVFSKETNQILKGDEDVALQVQIVQYSPFIQNLSNREIFGGYFLKSQGANKKFKQMFINRFLQYEIAFQTVDLFRNNCAAMLAQNDQYISSIYENFEKYASGYNDTNTTKNENENDVDNNIRKVNSAVISTPQDNPLVDLNNDIVDYADGSSRANEKTSNNKDINKNANEQTTSTNFNPDVLQKLDNLYSDKLNEFENALFLKIF
ncbi:MAG: hypothetical protein J6574_03900 [Gilliamella sp.]|nr:hypothetical protein [Gilliamella sp.]